MAKTAPLHICSLSNVHKRQAVVNTPAHFFCIFFPYPFCIFFCIAPLPFFAGARQRPRGHLVTSIQQPTLSQRVLVALVPLHELGDAIDVGEVANHVTVVEHLDGLALRDGAGKEQVL